MSNHDFETELRAALHEIGATDIGRRKRLPASVHGSPAGRCDASVCSFSGHAGALHRLEDWLVQALCLLAANAGLSNAFGMTYFTYPRLLVQCLCCLSVLVMLTALPVLYEAARARCTKWKRRRIFPLCGSWRPSSFSSASAIWRCWLRFGATRSG